MNSEANQLHPDFPIVSGHHKLTQNWSVDLNSQFNRRVEGGFLVLWKPGFTIWMGIWGNDKNESIPERIKWIKETTSPNAYELTTFKSGELQYLHYRLDEQSEDSRVSAMYGFVVSDIDQINLAFYFDEESSLSEAKAILKNVLFDKSN